MNVVLKKTLLLQLEKTGITRSLCCSGILMTKAWRLSQGLCKNQNAEGPLTDGQDYTFLDGRPTPLLHKQKLRLMKQRGYAEKILELHSELDFAIDREQKIIKVKEEERQRILGNRLKPKGFDLLRKY